jgi:hypothetical protein
MNSTSSRGRARRDLLPFVTVGLYVAALVWAGIVFLGLFFIPIGVVGGAGLVLSAIISARDGREAGLHALLAVGCGLVGGIFLAFLLVQLLD